MYPIYLYWINISTFSVQRCYLLSCEAADPEFPDIPVHIASTPTLNVLQLLQMVEGSGQPKGSAVEVPAPDVEGEEELAGKHQLAAPAGKVVAADGQNILQHTNSHSHTHSIVLPNLHMCTHSFTKACIGYNTFNVSCRHSGPARIFVETGPAIA